MSLSRVSLQKRNSSRDNLLYHVRSIFPNQDIYFRTCLIILKSNAYVMPATSRKLTVFGALRLLFPSLSAPSIEGGRPLGSP